MDLRPGYKQTEIGPIPEDWELARLKDRGSFSKGSGVRKDQANTGTLPCIRYGELYTDHHEIIREFRSFISSQVASTARKISTGDVIFAASGETKEEIGKCAAFLGSFEAFAGGDTIIFSPKRDDSRFLGYALNQAPAVRQKAARGQGDAVVHISTRALGDLAIPLPPLAEQQAIAEALLDVDAAIMNINELISKKRSLRTGSLQRLLTGETRLLGFSSPWTSRRLEDHVSFLKNGVQSRAQLTANDPVRYLHYGDIHVAQNLRLDLRLAEMPRLPAAEAARLSRLETGDVVFVDASEDLSGVGKSLEIMGAEDIEAVAGQHTIAARFDKDVLADGFKGYLQHIPAFTTHLRRLAAGTKVYATNRKHIASAEILLPEPDEQRVIVRVLSDMDAEITALEARLAKTRALKQGMMQALLTGRVRLPIQAEASDVLEVAHA